MASEKQIAANQANSLKSTGPRTEEGKSRSRLNALRHGLTAQVTILSEPDRDARENYTKPLIASLNPKTPQEEQLAALIAHSYWRLQRANAVEDNLFALGELEGAAQHIDSGLDEVHAALAQAQTFRDHAREFTNMSLYAGRLQSQCLKYEKQLQTLQAARKKQEDATEEQAVMLHRFYQMHHMQFDPSKNGFVYSIDDIEGKIQRDRIVSDAEYARRTRYNAKRNTHKPMAA